MTANLDIDEGWGPTVGGGRRRRRPMRWVLRLVLGALVVLVVALVAFVLWANAQIPRQEVGGLAARGGGPINVLLVGSDSREDLSDDERRELSTGSAEGERTDTIILLSVDGGDVALLSFPRDLWVTRCDGSVGRINAATRVGGPGCLATTVSSLSGIDIHHYATVTFGGFRDLVDAVGGVELCLEAPIADRDAGIDLPAGCQVLDGADALGFVRVRKIDDDFGRMGRQQEFLRAFAREVAQPSTVLDPRRLVRVTAEAGDTVVLDDGLGPFTLARLAWGARGLAAGGAATYTVPADPRTTSGGAAVLDVRTSEAEPLFAGFRDGSVLAEASATDGPDPADIEVAVRNAARVAGLAGSTAERLTALGYQVGSVGNAETLDRTLIRYPPGDAAAARRLAQDVDGDPELEETAMVDVVTLVLGRDQG